MHRLLLGMVIGSLFLGGGCFGEKAPTASSERVHPAPMSSHSSAPAEVENTQEPAGESLKNPNVHQEQHSSKWKFVPPAVLGLGVFGFLGRAFACRNLFHLGNLSDFTPCMVEPYTKAKSKFKNWRDARYVQGVNHRTFGQLAQKKALAITKINREGLQAAHEALESLIDAKDYDANRFREGYDALYGASAAFTLIREYKKDGLMKKTAFPNAYQAFHHACENEADDKIEFLAAALRSFDSLEWMSFQLDAVQAIIDEGNTAHLDLFLQSQILVNLP